jgi:hypothetical protein
MRVAALRTIGLVLAVFALALLWQTAVTIHGDIEEEQVFVICTTMLLSVMLAWIGSMFLRAPRGLQRATLAVIIVLLVPTAALQSQQWAGSLHASGLTARQREALEYLRHADYIEHPLVGFAAVYSRGYIAMRLLQQSADADAAFKELVLTGTPAGRVYGLIGVYKTDPVYFQQALLTAPRGDVGVSSGCVLGDEPIRDLIARNDAFEVGRHETLDAALKRQPGKHDIHLDIAHGGYSAMYFDADITSGDALRASELRAAELTYDFKRDR